MIIEKLHEQKKFTDSEKHIAAFIEKKGEEIISMTVREFADASLTSPTVVMRFCRKLGCEGFRDFKVKYLRELEQMKHETAQVDFSRPFYIGYSAQKITEVIYTLQKQTMKDVVDSMDYAKMEKAARILTNARTIYLYGRGDSSIRARNFMNRLFKIKKMCILATESHEEAGMSNNVTANDAAIFISYRGGNRSFEKCMEVVQASGAKAIVLSADFHTKLTENCDVWLSVPDREKTIDNIGTFYSQTAFDFILNTLYSLIYSNSYTKSHEHKKKIDEYTALK